MKRFNVQLVALKATSRYKFLSTFLLILTGFTFAPLAIATDVELIVNGGFEEPVVTSPIGWTTYFGQNYTSGIPTCPPATLTCNDGTLIPGWSVIWSHPIGGGEWPGDPDPGRIELQANNTDPALDLCPSLEGFQKAELDSHHRVGDTRDNNATIYQTFYTCPRLPYEFNYSWKGRADVVGMNDMDVLIDDVLLTQHVEYDAVWRSEQYFFTANPTGVTTVAFHSCGDWETHGVFLDAISVVGPDGSEPELCDDPQNLCEHSAKPIELTLLYDGNDDTFHHQFRKNVSIVPEVVEDYPDPAYIRIYGQKKHSPVLYSGMYGIGQKIVISGPLKRIPPRLKFEILDPATGALVQWVEFHTACHKPLFVGDEFGAITVLSLIQ